MAALGLAVWNRDGTIDRSENEREREAVTPSASCFFRLAQNASRAFTAVFSSGSTLLLPRSHYDSPFSLYPSVCLSVSFCLVTFSPSHRTSFSLSFCLSVRPSVCLSPFSVGRYLPVALLNVISPIVRSASTSPYTGCA